MCNCKDDYLVVCPYYRADENQAIHCEGVEDGTRLHLGFGTRKQKKEYAERLCREKWTGCLLAKMLNQKYDYTP